MKNLLSYLSLSNIFAFLPAILFFMPSPDARWAGVYIVSIILIPLLLKINLWIPDQPKIAVCSILLIACGILASYNVPGYYAIHATDWACFVLIAIAAFNLVSLKPLYRVNAILTVLAVTYGVTQYLLIPERWAASFLLHQNIMSEFLGISLLLQLASGSFFLVGITIAYIYVLYTRAVWVALLAVAVLVFFRNPRKFKPLLPQLLIGFVLILSLQLATNKTDPISPVHGGIHTSKSDSTDIRLKRWNNSLDMLLDNPLGVGPGNYEWNYTVYAKTDPEHKPRLNIRSPHNGYLELAIEWGIPALLIFLAAFALILKISYPNVLAFSGLIFLAVDAFFAFPVELGYTFFFSAFFLGQGLKNSKSFHLKPNSALIYALIFILLILPAGLSTTAAEYLETTKTMHGLKTGCRLKSRDWQLCLNYGVNLFQKKQYPAAKAVFQEILKYRPNMHPAIALLAKTEHMMGNKEQAAYLFETYKSYFNRADR